MAFRLVANFEPTTDGHFIWKMKEELVADGWVVRSSGTGTGGVYGAASDVHALGGPYVNTLDLSTAWFCIRQPVSASPRREFVFFRPSTTHGVWRIYYSSDGTGFTGGTPSATVAPTATDAPGGASLVGQMYNGNSNTNNLFSTLAVRQYRQDILIGNSAEGFSFLTQARKIGLNASYLMIGLDVLLNANGLDTDPAMTIISGALGSDSERGVGADNVAAFLNSDTATTTVCRGWYLKGGGSAAWVNYPMPGFGWQNGSSQFNMVGTTSPPSVDVNGRMPSFPMLWSRGGAVHATQRGFKGRSRLFRYEMQQAYGRPYADRSRWIMGSFSIPWDGVTKMAM